MNTVLVKTKSSDKLLDDGKETASSQMGKYFMSRSSISTLKRIRKLDLNKKIAGLATDKTKIEKLIKSADT